MKKLISEIKQCTICEPHLAMGCNPVFTAAKTSKIVVIGQAPGRKVHESGIAWDDMSGDNLRKWMGVTKDEFYDTSLFALVPMGFCYPGKGRSGDLPPRKECAPQWHHELFKNMADVALTLLIGQYAQQYYLPDTGKRTLTETVKHYKDYLPDHLPLPHPSPRNNIWQKKNPWFAKNLLPELKHYITRIKEG